MKTYTLKKTIKANSLEEAIKQDKKTPVESCWIKEEVEETKVGF